MNFVRMNNSVVCRKNAQKPNESYSEYLKRAAKHARRLVNRYKSHYDYKYFHESFLIRDVLLAVEKSYGLNMFGVEYINKGKNRKSPSITYLNTGDSYGLTILYVKGRFRVGDWGSIVEIGNYD